MGPESKGRALLGKIYKKLETILVEVDTFTSQNTLCSNSTDPSGWEVGEDLSSDLQQHHDRLALPSCESPSAAPSRQNSDISGAVRVVEKVSEDIPKDNLPASSLSVGETFVGAPLLPEYCAGNLTSATTRGDDEEPIVNSEESQISNTLTQKISAGEALGFPSEESVEEVRAKPFRDFFSTESQSTRSSVQSCGVCTNDSEINPTDTKIPDAPVQDNVANMRTSNEGSPDDVPNGKSDVTPLDTKASSGMAFGKDPLYVDNNALYAVRVRTKKLRSFKRKILDALTAKRRREKEYEQLAIWFGDADMGSDLIREDSAHKEAIDSKSSQVHESEHSQWELL